jgi:putative nucleotidyltransferase with HDIG domain
MTLFLDRNNIFYHGTRAKFDTFRPLSHFGSYSAAQECVLLWPCPKDETLDTRNEYSIQMPPSFKNDSTPKIIPVQLNLTNTYEIDDFGGTSDINYFQCVVLYHIVHDLKLNNIPYFYDYIFTEPFHIPTPDVKKELQTDNLYNTTAQQHACHTPEQVNRYHLYQQRMIQYFEHLGYDGFNYTNRREDRGHTSYIVFRPENIARMDLGQKTTPREPLEIHADYQIFPCRKMAEFEKILLRKAESSHACSMDIKQTIWSNINNLRSRPSVIKSAVRAREYYTKLLTTDILPKIQDIGTQKKYGYHGIYTHTFQVVQFAIELAISVGTDPLPVILGAALHDIARTHDDDDFTHGPRGAAIARNFLTQNYNHLFPETIDKIVYAVQYHTQGTIAPDLISSCVWDADRIRLSWEMGYHEKYFNTAYGNYIASLPPQMSDKGRLSQEQYMKNQNKFLRRHNIKTR